MAVGSEVRGRGGRLTLSHWEMFTAPAELQDRRRAALRVPRTGLQPERGSYPSRVGRGLAAHARVPEALSRTVLSRRCWQRAPFRRGTEGDRAVFGTCPRG